MFYWHDCKCCSKTLRFLLSCLPGTKAFSLYMSSESHTSHNGWHLPRREEDSHHFEGRMNCVSSFLFSAEEKYLCSHQCCSCEDRRKNSDISNWVACSVCAMTAQACWSLIYPCKQTFFHVVPNTNSPCQVGSVASSQL